MRRTRSRRLRSLKLQLVDTTLEAAIEEAAPANEEVAAGGHAAAAPLPKKSPREFEIHSAIEATSAAAEPVASENEIDLSSEWEDSLTVETDAACS